MQINLNEISLGTYLHPKDNTILVVEGSAFKLRDTAANGILLDEGKTLPEYRSMNGVCSYEGTTYIANLTAEEHKELTMYGAGVLLDLSTKQKSDANKNRRRSRRKAAGEEVSDAGESFLVQIRKIIPDPKAVIESQIEYGKLQTQLKVSEQNNETELRNAKLRGDKESVDIAHDIASKLGGNLTTGQVLNSFMNQGGASGLAALLGAAKQVVANEPVTPPKDEKPVDEKKSEEKPAEVGADNAGGEDGK